MESITKSKMHVGLNVSNISRTISFYETLFNQKADKVREGYAKFILPELVISFIGTDRKPDHQFGHLGFQIQSKEEVKSTLERVKAANIETLEEEQVSCCYALQDKFWVSDPDGFRWEYYYFHEDVEVNDNSDCCPDQKTGNQEECCTDKQKAEAAGCC